MKSAVNSPSSPEIIISQIASLIVFAERRKTMTAQAAEFLPHNPNGWC